MGQHGADRGRPRLGERLDGRVHRLRGDRLEHMHGEQGFASDRPLQTIVPLTRAGVTSSSWSPCSSRPSSTIDDGFAHRRSQRAREVGRVMSGEGGAAITNLVGFDEKARHGSVHGAAPASRYGGRVAEVHLTARTAEGVALSVVVTGEGDPLLLIPGLGAGRSAFTASSPTSPEPTG